MKKAFLVFATAVSLAACSNSSNSAADTKDSIDSAASEKKEMIDSTADQKKDMIDSSADKMKEGVDKIDSAKNAMDTATKK